MFLVKVNLSCLKIAFCAVCLITMYLKMLFRHIIFGLSFPMKNSFASLASCLADKLLALKRNDDDDELFLWNS